MRQAIRKKKLHESYRKLREYQPRLAHERAQIATEEIEGIFPEIRNILGGQLFIEESSLPATPKLTPLIAGLSQCLEPVQFAALQILRTTYPEETRGLLELLESILVIPQISKVQVPESYAHLLSASIGLLERLSINECVQMDSLVYLVPALDSYINAIDIESPCNLKVCKLLNVRVKTLGILAILAKEVNGDFFWSGSKLNRLLDAVDPKQPGQITGFINLLSHLIFRASSSVQKTIVVQASVDAMDKLSLSRCSQAVMINLIISWRLLCEQDSNRATPLIESFNFLLEIDRILKELPNSSVVGQTLKLITSITDNPNFHTDKLLIAKIDKRIFSNLKELGPYGKSELINLYLNCLSALLFTDDEHFSNLQDQMAELILPLTRREETSEAALDLYRVCSQSLVKIPANKTDHAVARAAIKVLEKCEGLQCIAPSECRLVISALGALYSVVDRQKRWSEAIPQSYFEIAELFLERPARIQNAALKIIELLEQQDHGHGRYNEEEKINL